MLAILIAVGGTVGGTAAVSTASASAAGLNAAGSTLVQPLFTKWMNGFEIKEGIPVKYSGVGSGEGIKLVSKGRFSVTSKKSNL
ncbi:MAG TPA: substrate-binding domain-containing protein [Solirubrobacterales bacterium]